MCKEKENKNPFQEFQKAMDSLEGIVYSAPKEQENRTFGGGIENFQKAMDALVNLPQKEPLQQTEPARHFEENEINAYEASVNKVTDAIMDEIAANNLDDGKLLGSVIATLVRRRLGDISVAGPGVVDIVRSRGDQWCLVESCTESYIIGSIKDYAKDYVDHKFYGKSENDWHSPEPV